MASRIKGITIEIDGNTTKLQEALQSVNNSLNSTKGALNDVNRLLKMDPGNTDLIRQKQEYLKQAIDDTEEKLKQEKEALRQLEEAGSTEKNQEQQRALKRDIEATEQSLKSLKKQAAETSSVLGTKMQAAGQKMQEVGKKITGVGRNLSMYVTAPLTAVGAASISVTKDFDESMSKVMALSGATGDEFNQLRDLARDMGSSTKYSASEAADALGFMALAGWDTQQMTEGLPGILDLAAASGMELADASDLVTDYLSAFGLEAKDAGKMADMLAYAQANSNTTTSQLGEAFGNCATKMHSAGQSMETTTALLEVFANNGLKGAKAGTALNAMMRDITQHMKDGKIQIGDYAIQVMDANGNFRDMVDILADVETATYGMGTAEREAALMTTFTDKSIKAATQALDAGADQIREYRDELYNSGGTARTMAEIMQDNLNGELTKLKSALQEVAISLGDSLVPMMRKAVEFIQGLVDKFNDLDEGTKETIVKVGLFAAAIGPALTVVGLMTTGIGGLVENIGKAINGFEGFAGGLGAIPFSGVTLAILGVVGALGMIKVGLDQYEENLRNNNEEIYKTIDAAEEARKKMETTGDQIGSAYEEAETKIAATTEAAELAAGMVDRLEELLSIENKSSAEMAEMQALVTQLNALYPGMNAQIDENGQLLGISTQEMRNFIDTALETATLEARQQALQEATQEMADAYIAKAEGAIRLKEVEAQLADAEAELADRQERAAAITEADIDQNLYGATVDQYRANIIGDQAKVVADLTAEKEALTAQDEELTAQIAEGTEYIDKMDAELASMADTSTEAGDAAEDAAGSMDGLGDEAEEAAGQIEEAVKSIEEVYTELYDSAYESLTGQGNLWNEYTLQTEHSTEELQTNMQQQAEFYQTWSNDLATVWDYAVQTGDQSTMAMVQALAGMGEEGAGHVHDLAAAIEDGNADIVNSMSDTVGDLQSTQAETANILAQIEGNMVQTSDGLVYTTDYTGQQITNKINKTGQEAESSWEGTMNSMESTTESAMGNVESDVNSGMTDTQNTISGSRGGMESSTSNAMDGMQAQARMAAGNMQGYGSEAISNFESGMWSQQSGVSSAAAYIASQVSANLDVGGNAYWWGHGLGVNFANGINAAGQYAVAAAASIAAQVSALLHHSTPEKGPLHGDDKWGSEMIENFASGMLGETDLVKKAAGEVADAAVIQSPTNRHSSTVNITGGEGTPLGSLMGLLEKWLPVLATSDVRLDSGALVGQIAPAMNRELGVIGGYGERGI